MTSSVTAAIGRMPTEWARGAEASSHEHNESASAPIPMLQAFSCFIVVLIEWELA